MRRKYLFLIIGLCFLLGILVNFAGSKSAPSSEQVLAQVLTREGSPSIPATAASPGSVLAIIWLPYAGATFTNTTWAYIGQNSLSWVYPSHYGLTATNYEAYLVVNNSLIGGSWNISHYRLVCNGSVVAGSECQDALAGISASLTTYSDAPMNYGSPFTIPWNWSGGNHLRLQAYGEELMAPDGDQWRVNWAYLIIKAK
ncbi:MAG: hypothetical protein WCB96_13500 [Candidatus Aminicenantales bacterium]